MYMYTLCFKVAGVARAACWRGTLGAERETNRLGLLLVFWFLLLLMIKNEDYRRKHVKEANHIICKEGLLSIHVYRRMIYEINYSNVIYTHDVCLVYIFT